jgi:hypothetical protein
VNNSPLTNEQACPPGSWVMVRRQTLAWQRYHSLLLRPQIMQICS